MPGVRIDGDDVRCARDAGHVKESSFSRINFFHLVVVRALSVVALGVFGACSPASSERDDSAMAMEAAEPSPDDDDDLADAAPSPRPRSDGAANTAGRGEAGAGSNSTRDAAQHDAEFAKDGATAEREVEAGSGRADAATPDASSADSAGSFVLIPVDFPMYNDELTFPESANPPSNQSPAFEWRGVPSEAKSLALVFRDLGNGAVKWILWDMPPDLTRVPSNISKTSMPSEVPGSSQLGSLDNQGYAGPGSGARQYDFKLWALKVDKLPVTGRLTTKQIHDELLPKHVISQTAPVLLRNTRNLR